MTLIPKNPGTEVCSLTKKLCRHLHLKSLVLAIATLFLNAALCYSQCQIPNGSFNNWLTEGDSSWYTYDLPVDWTESIIPNVFSRFYNGTGFFYKYDSSDANGNAVSLFRGVPGSTGAPENSGFVRFECDNIPEDVTVKLKGRYKFSGSDIPGKTDTLIIAAYFSPVADTLSLLDLHTRVLPERARDTTIVEPSPHFSDFEIDLSEFAGQDIDYTTIQLIMKTGNDDPFVPGFSTAVVDDLTLIYETVVGVSVHVFDKQEPVVYPNPTQGMINIRFENIERRVSLQIFNITGELVWANDYANLRDVQIDLEEQPKGVYIVKCRYGIRSFNTFKIMKD